MNVYKFELKQITMIFNHICIDESTVHGLHGPPPTGQSLFIYVNMSCYFHFLLFYEYDSCFSNFVFVLFTTQN